MCYESQNNVRVQDAYGKYSIKNSLQSILETLRTKTE